MITLTRLNGATFALNDQMVERVEANPHTVVVLADGKKFIVAESVDEVVEQIRRSRADVALRASMVEVVEDPGPELRLIRGRKSESSSAGDGDEAGGEGFDAETVDGRDVDTHRTDDLPAKEGGSWTQ